jgi:hypothetical protein
MKNNIFRVVSPALILAALLAAACSNIFEEPAQKANMAAGRGTARISIGGRTAGGRTLLPDHLALHYVAEFTKGGDSVPAVIGNGTNADVALDEGAWDLTVRGYLTQDDAENNPDYPVITGAAGGPVEIKSGGITPVTVTLTPPPAEGGEGWVGFTLVFPDTVTQAGLTATALLDTPASALGQVDLLGAAYRTDNGSKGQLDLAAGYYRLKYTLETSDGLALARTMVVHVYNGLVTPLVETFEAGDFTEAFVPVSGIDGAPDANLAFGGTINLGTAKVTPDEATNTYIAWVLTSAGDTGVSAGDVAKGSFSPNTGTLVLTATVKGGKGRGEDYTGEFAITVAPPKAAKPAAEPAGGEVTTNDTITLSSATDGADIYYTTDGSDPKTSGTKQTYTDPFSLSEGTVTLKAIAVMEGRTDSDILEAEYTVTVPLTKSVHITPSGGNKTSVDTSWEGWDEEGPEQAVKLLLPYEELTAYFSVVKETAQTINAAEGYEDKVTVITDKETDGTTPDDEKVVVAVDLEDLVFDGTDEQGKATKTFDLVVSEEDKQPVTLTVNLELTLPQTATIYQKKDGKWEKINAALTQEEINANYSGGSGANKNIGAITLTPGTVTNLQNAIAWVDINAKSGNGENLEPGTTDGYSQYRIFIKRDERIGKVFLRFNTADYVSLELYGAGVPGAAERRVSFNQEFITTDHVLKKQHGNKPGSVYGFITVYHEDNEKYKTLVLGKNITIDGENIELTWTHTGISQSFDYILGIQNLLYAGNKAAIIMRPHSKITGYYTQQYNNSVIDCRSSSVFYMQGGEISGNRVNWYSTKGTPNGVIQLYHAESNFVYTGGTVTGNTICEDNSSANKVRQGGSIYRDFDNL